MSGWASGTLGEIGSLACWRQHGAAYQRSEHHDDHTFGVGDLFSILGARGIERQIRRMTVKTSTALQHAPTHECCGGKTPRDATATAVAVPPSKQAASGSSPKSEVPRGRGAVADVFRLVMEPYGQGGETQ